MRTTRDFEQFVSTGTITKLLNVASENDFCVDYFEGVVLDSYIIHANSKLKVGNWKPRNYILAVATFKNAWESVYKLVLTDKKETVEKYFGKDFETGSELG